MSTMQGLITEIFGLTVPITLASETQARIATELLTWIRTICTEPEAQVLIEHYGLEGIVEKSMYASESGRTGMTQLKKKAISHLTAWRNYAPVIVTLAEVILQEEGSAADKERASEYLRIYREEAEKKAAACQALIVAGIDPKILPVLHALGLDRTILKRLLKKGWITNELQLFSYSSKTEFTKGLNGMGDGLFTQVQEAFAKHGITWPIKKE
jgi:hypothetical protein